MSGYLLDTSVVIDYLRRKDKGETLFYKLSVHAVSVSIIAHAEVYSGKSVWEHTESRKTVEIVFASIHILPLSMEISRRAGYIKTHSGTSFVDCVIAATAIHHDLALVTLNIKDFASIAGLELFDTSRFKIR